MRDLPRNHFGAILCDPPWSFRTYGGEDAVPTLGEDPYETMALEELKALPVAEVAAPDCLMVMWVISSHIPQAIELAEHWGFTYRSLGPVWFKDRHPDQLEMFGDGPICDLGMGYWFRQQCEIALVFGRGSPKRLNADVRQVISEPRRQYCRQPDGACAKGVRVLAGAYVDMFGRQSRPNWTVWGNEAAKFDV